MKRIIISLVTVLAINHIANCANAAEKFDKYPEIEFAELQKFLNYSKSEFIMRSIQDRIIAADKKLGFECDDEYQVKLDNMDIITPVKFPVTSEYPISGIWMYHVELSRCNKSYVRNIFFVADKDKEPSAYNTIGGKTMASPILVRDTINTVFVKAAEMSRKDCNIEDFKKTLSAGDSKILEKTKEFWREEWTVHACDKDYPVRITFMPDGRGGTGYVIEK